MPEPTPPNDKMTPEQPKKAYSKPRLEKESSQTERLAGRAPHVTPAQAPPPQVELSAKSIGELAQAVGQKSTAAETLRSGAELAGAAAVAIDEVGEAITALKPEGRPKESQPEPAQPLPQPEPAPAQPQESDYSGLSIGKLQRDIERAELGSQELKDLKAEKQRRVDDLIKSYEKPGGVTFKGHLEMRIADALKAATPAYYVGVLKKNADEPHSPFTEEEDSALYRIVVRDEFNRVLQKIYLGAEKSQDPPVNRADPESIRSIEERVAKSRVDAGVDIDNPIDRLGALPPTFEEWKQQNGWYASDTEISNAVANYYRLSGSNKQQTEAGEVERTAKILSNIFGQGGDQEEPRTGAREQLDERIFGRANSFGEKFRIDHKLPKTIPANRAAGISKPFDPVEAFNEVATSGLNDQPAWYRATSAIETSGDAEFRISARNGLLRLLVLDIAMKASRIDAMANDSGGILKSELGVTPEGVAQWLKADPDTKDALGYLLRAQGYTVSGILGNISSPPSFADFQNLSEEDLKVVLDRVARKVGCEPGNARIAYTIFRWFGFPHGNKHYKDLLKDFGAELRPEEKESFFDKKEMGKIVSTSGMDGLIYKLAGLGSQEPIKYWEGKTGLRINLLTISDARKGMGKFLGTSLSARHTAINTAIAELTGKQIIDNNSPSVARLSNEGKISISPPALSSQPSFVSREGAALAKVLNDITFGLFRRRS